MRWDLFSIQVDMDSSCPVQTLRTLFVVTSGAKVLGAARLRFFKVTHFNNARYTYVHVAVDSGPCPTRCWHAP